MVIVSYLHYFKVIQYQANAAPALLMPMLLTYKGIGGQCVVIYEINYQFDNSASIV